MKNIEKKYDDLLKDRLEKNLKRSASNDEISNAENDTDLTLQVIWEIVKELENRITILEKK